ncbi:hypothetical protein [Actinoallomurus acanthiterrae]
MGDTILNELRAAVAERRQPAPAVRRALAGSADAALMRKAGCWPASRSRTHRP